jgi:hypothetical protein
MKQLIKGFTQFVNESASSSDLPELIRLGLIDPRDVFQLPIGGGYDEDEDPTLYSRVEGDIKALEWLGYPAQVIVYSPNSDYTGGSAGPLSKVKELGRIAGLVEDPTDPSDLDELSIDQLNTGSMQKLYSYEEYRDWADYFGTEVDGKKVVVIHAPDGPYFMFSPADFTELAGPLSRFTYNTVK